MQVNSRLQIIIRSLKDFIPDSEIASRNRVAQILESNLDQNLAPLPDSREGEVIAKLAGNIINGRSNPRTAIENLIEVGGKAYCETKKPKPDIVLESLNPLFATLTKKEERKYLIRRLNTIVLIESNFDDIKIEEGEIVFYLDGELVGKAEFNNAAALQIVIENDLDVADFLVSVCRGWITSDNELTAISNPDKIAQFFNQNGVEVHVNGDTLIGKGVGASQEDARPRRESTPINDFGKLEFDGHVLTRNGGVQIIGENPKDAAVLDGMVDLLKNGILRLQDLTYPFSFISSPIRRSEGVFIEFTQDAEVWLEAQKTKV